MDSKRQEKFARLIQKDLGEIFQQSSRQWFQGAFITISGVKVSPDLGYARVYLSVFQVKDKNELLDLVRFYGKDIRKQLALRIKNQVRKVPELEFFLDESLDYVMHMEDVFRKIREEGSTAEDKEEE